MTETMANELSVTRQAMAIEPPLVFIHGIKGSHLQRTGSSSCCVPRRQYINVGALVCGCLGRDQMPLPWSYDDTGNANQHTDGIVSAGIVKDVNLCGCITVSAIYTPFFDWATNAGRRCTAFDYDWRRSPLEAGHKFERFLEELLVRDKAASGWDGGAQVVCHSNGGLVTFPLLNRRPDLFHSVVFAAAALRGGVGFLHDMSMRNAVGNKLPCNSTMMTPLHWIGWTTGYYFMPLRGERAAGNQPYFVEADGQTEVDVDLHSPEDWEKYQLGPFDPRSGCQDVCHSPQMKQFLSETLQRAKAYRQLMVCDPGVNYPPIAVLASNDDVNNITGWRRPGPGQPFAFDDPSVPPLTHPGDGRIAFETAGPAEGVPVWRTVTCKLSHEAVPCDMPIVSELLAGLSEEARRQGRVRGSRKD